MNPISATAKIVHSRKSVLTKEGLKSWLTLPTKQLYEYMQRRVESPKGKQMKSLRSSTVEPVFGSLINYTGLNRINPKRLEQANKCMLIAAAAYNLKKLLKLKFEPLIAAPTPVINGLNVFLNDLFTWLNRTYTSFKRQQTQNLLPAF